MKLLKLISLAVIIPLTLLYSHEPNKAYFEFWQEGHTITVRAEFPWTMRLALLKAFPQIKEKSVQEDFDNAIFDYFSKAIVIKENNKNVKLLSVKQLPQDHSHSVIYKLVFGQVKELEGISITNFCLNNLYDDQINYNTIYLTEKNKFSIITEKNNPNFTVLNELSE